MATDKLKIIGDANVWTVVERYDKGHLRIE
jgi:hypothetical protein